MWSLGSPGRRTGNSYRLPAWTLTGPQAPPPTQPAVIARGASGAPPHRAVGDRRRREWRRGGPTAIGVERPHPDGRALQPGVLREVECLPGHPYGPALANDVVGRLVSCQKSVIGAERPRRRACL